MANNQYVNKVVYGNTTLIDTSNVTVTPATLQSGVTALDKSGSLIVGILSEPTFPTNAQDGSGVVLSGTTAPTSVIGSNEDLYVQYTAHTGWNHTYGIDAIFRKVNGTWEAYTEPIDPNAAIHVWTKSTGGNDATMYVQKATYDPSTGTYTAIGDAVSVLYIDIRGTNPPYDCYGLAELSYGKSGSRWRITATINITDDTNTYSNGDTVAEWSYANQQDIYLRRAS